MSYVGIDLGTTNSAICSYDGAEVTLYKSPEQTDVTPSAIFVTSRGNRYVGLRAYNQAAQNPDNAATLFKRFMGTSTPVKLSAVGLTMTPEECSAEILRTLFGYLPELIRNAPEVGTVITVPAAFNQMQKDATMQAAETAGIGKVALMQEPVAAVMSVMRKRQGDGIFLVYDIGGGTLDIAIAQSIAGRVSLLGQGGIPMCGGRDFDRILVDNVLTPWLLNTFDLPEDYAGRAEYRRLRRMAEFATEKAKIELSKQDDAIISAIETDIATKDQSGAEIYFDCPLDRSQLDDLISEKIADSISAAREAIEKAGLSPHDFERVVFVGGPSQYKPLRDRVAFDLGIAASTDVNPMTAVAEGAALFAESIDWGSQNRARKSTRGKVNAGGNLDITLNYVARTPDIKTKVAIKTGASPLPGSSFQVDSLDTGWSSGRIDLKDGAIFEVPLPRPGENAFKVFVFDPNGGAIRLSQDRIVITRAAATVDAIPASHSIGIEVRDRVGGPIDLVYLVRKGDPLPAKGRKKFKAAESLRAHAPGALNFIIREGEIEHPVSDNAFIGLFEVKGSDFADGVIPAGADLICDYEILDSGNVILKVTVPSVGGAFDTGRNFYSRKEAEVDFTRAAKRIIDDAAGVEEQIDELERQVDDPALAAARERLSIARDLPPTESNPEAAKEAMGAVQKAKEMLAAARKANLRVVRRIELDDLVKVIDGVRQLAKPAEISEIDALIRTAERAMPDPKSNFDTCVSELRYKLLTILHRQDWFIVDRFNWYKEVPHLFADADLFARLVKDGEMALAAGDADRVRRVLRELDLIRISPPSVNDMLASPNILRG